MGGRELYKPPIIKKKTFSLQILMDSKTIGLVGRFFMEVILIFISLKYLNSMKTSPAFLLILLKIVISFTFNFFQLKI